MNLKLLIENPDGCTLFAFTSIYFVVNCYILYQYFIKGERRVYLHKILLAFASFFALGMQELFFYLFCGVNGESAARIPILNIKLFIYSSFFVVMLFQSMGFMEEGLRTCLKYQISLMLFMLSLDLLYYGINLHKQCYTVILSGLLIVVLGYLWWRFSAICLNRCDTIMKTMDKRNMIMGFCWLAAVVFMSYMVIISQILSNSYKFCMFTLILLMLGHLFFVYKERKTYPKVKRTYSIAAEEDKSNDLLMEEAVTEDFKIIQRLVTYFEDEKPYLDKEIKIGEVAKKIYTNKTYLSRALNQRMFKNFSQFVNYYRVKEACALFLADPLLNLTDLCYKSGFKNVTSFSSAFNLNLRYTPSEWCKEIRGKIQNNEEVSIEDYFI